MYCYRLQIKWNYRWTFVGRKFRVSPVTQSFRPVRCFHSFLSLGRWSGLPQGPITLIPDFPLFNLQLYKFPEVPATPSSENFRIYEYVHKIVHCDHSNEQKKEVWVCECVWVWVSVCESVCLCEWVKVCVCVCEWVTVCVSDWAWVWVSVRSRVSVCERLWVSVWKREWVSESVCEWMTVCVR
jgi:hypothetical protein